MRRALGALATVLAVSSPGFAAMAAEPQIPPQYVEQVRSWATAPTVLLTLRAANEEHRKLTDKAIQDLDTQWRQQRDAERQPLIAEVLAAPLSSYLMRRHAAAQGQLIEVFVMSSKGLNVGQSAITSDLWQGDEAKFERSFGRGTGAVHYGPVETKSDTGRRAQQVSLAISDPDSGTVIGAITAEFDLDLIALSGAAD
jgi:hypothetical protein